MEFPRIIIAAPGSGQGKTTFSMGLMAALCKRGMKVQPYKVGPDYIDPAFHTAITGRNSINLDSWLLEDDYIKDMFWRYSQEADISVIEGVMGLYDGMEGDPMKGSTAGIAKLLDAPVILIMQAAGMSASAAAMVNGFRDFGGLNIAGVVINRPSSVNHYNSVKAAVERYSEIRVLGYIPNEDKISLKSRHLGLVQSCETEELNSIVDRLAALIEDNADVAAVLDISRGGGAKSAGSGFEYRPSGIIKPEQRVKIAVALDKAFNFYYHENLRILESLGAELHYFSPLEDKKLPEGCSGVYIGGGYPEVFAEQLEANSSMREDILHRANDGLPIYAECGGYMYLNRNITTPEGKTYQFVGIFDGEAEMTGKLQNFGYAELEFVEDSYLLNKGEKVRIHEFHRSIVKRRQEKTVVRVRKQRGGRIDEWDCGMTRANVIGFYPHVYFPSNIKLAESYIQKCMEYKNR